ncbi:hypothetical protein [Fontivita pretiosa]|uniref:hypothetical protein n=1 Tax=Fontivita pretiosa TaxID=2989684 RepID=UPI003D185921
MLSAAGEVRLQRKYFWGKQAGGCCPGDALAGVQQSNVTPGARQLCCLMGIGQDFDQSRRDLKRVGGLSLSKERLRQITEGEGQHVRQVRDSGQLPAAWSAEQAKLPDGSGRTRAYGGVDGVMAPTVTQAEKLKRRQQHVTRRQQRGKAGVGNAKDLPPPKPGSDERFKEMKIAVFYDQDKTHRHVLATEKLSKEFAPLLASYARQIGFERADQTICLFDGAVWIYRQVCLALLFLQVILLDFYHLAEHVHATARCCLGEGQAARSWAHDRLAEAKRSDVRGMLSAIAELEKRSRSPTKKQSLRGLRNYLEQRRDMLDYAQALAEGWDIGSGPTEATCKTLTLRLKRPGMKWDRDNAAAMMNLLALRESGQWDAYWDRESRRAA